MGKEGYSDAEIEWVARAMCANQNVNSESLGFRGEPFRLEHGVFIPPDAEMEPVWKLYKTEAVTLLNALNKAKEE